MVAKFLLLGSCLLLLSLGFNLFGLSSPAVLFLLNRMFLFYVCYGYTHQLFYRPQNLLGGVLVLVVLVLVVVGVFLWIYSYVIIAYHGVFAIVSIDSYGVGSVVDYCAIWYYRP